MKTSSTDSDSVFLSNNIPVEDLPKPPPKYRWIDILKRVQPGHARQVKMRGDTVKRAINRLEKAHKIKKGEYSVKTSKVKGSKKRQVYLIRHILSEKS